MTHLFLWAGAAAAANPALTLRVSSETAPAGGFAQIKIYSTTPALIASGGITLNLDPAVFGNAASASVFSATGDQLGDVRLNGQQVTAYFTSASGGLGQLPGLPILVVNVPVLPNLQPGATTSVTADATVYPWMDLQKNTYTVSAVSGTFAVASDPLAVQSVTPGGGVIPAGGTLAIQGSGFDASTTVTIDGVSIASQHLVSAQEIDVTPGGATEVSGHRVHVTNSAGAAVDFFPAFVAQGTPGFDEVPPLLPLAQGPFFEWDRALLAIGSERIYYFLQNPSGATVTATFTVGSGLTQTKTDVDVPPYGMMVQRTDDVPGEHDVAFMFMTATAPLRMGELKVVTNSFLPVPPELTYVPPQVGNAAGPPSSAPPQPLISAVLASGSMLPGPVSPGELITLLGQALGGSPATLQLDSNGKVTTALGGVQLLINGTAAPLIYTAANQINAIVPDSVSPGDVVPVQAVVAGEDSGPAWGLPVTAAAPSVFSLSGSGVGDVAAVQQDGTVINAANPAVRGTAIDIFATGGGQTGPAFTTGEIAPAAANLALETKVTIGGLDAQVIYSGAATYEVQGVVQINVIVPLGLQKGDAWPVEVSIGGIKAQAGVTIAVR